MARNALHQLAALATALLPIATTALPQGHARTGTLSAAAPTLQNLTFAGPGCSSAVQVMRGDTSVWLFPEWDMKLPPDSEAEYTDYLTITKWCTEELLLVNATKGTQVRIDSVAISGWADLDVWTWLALSAETSLGGVPSGVSSCFVHLPTRKHLDREDDLLCRNPKSHRVRRS